MEHSMEVFTAAGLFLLALVLFLAAMRGWIHNDTIQLGANVAAIVALLAAVAVFFLPSSQTGTNNPQQSEPQPLVLSQRPWVSADVAIAGPLFVEHNSPAVRLNITLRNTGNSPATSIIPFPIMTMREQQPLNMLESQTRRCSTLRRPPGPGSGLGYTLFPGGTVTEYNTPSMAREEIESIGFNIAPLIIICINYKFTFSDESHQTATIYLLGRRNPEYPGQAFVIDLRASPIPAESLQLIPMGSYAD
jgi:hypothetical protein